MIFHHGRLFTAFIPGPKKSGLWDEILQFLLEITRQIEYRNAQPSYAIIDSQSVKTIGASEERGIDGGKKIKGRKRHIVVDAMGNLLSVKVHAANVHDTRSGIWPAEIALSNYP